MEPGAFVSVEQDDLATALYELSKHPKFPALIKLLQYHAGDYYADMPRKGEDKTAYETSNYVANTIRGFIAKLTKEIEVGKRLSEPDDAGGESDAEQSGHSERQRA